MASSLAPFAGFRERRRSRSRSIGVAHDETRSFNDILFPRMYEQAWGITTDGNNMYDRSEMDRARIFLMRFTKMNGDQLTNNELIAIVSNQSHYTTITEIASAVMTRIFGSRHASFSANPLLQCIRFMLIKAQTANAIFTEKTRQIVDFFFDPTMARNLDPPPEDPVVYPYPEGRLKVCIVGGGPTALASAISLAEKGAGQVEVHMYERRWVWKQDDDGSFYVAYPPNAKRRDQVVTLQESVTSLMSPGTLQALFQGRPEHVWPGSANIQIRKVEDRLLKRCRDMEFQGLIHLHPEGVTQEDLYKVGDFHVLLGADGAASWVRNTYFRGYENERGRSYALGLAFDRPQGLPWSQPLNVFLTLGQTRYLLNASDHDGRGYLNMQLTENEWHKMLSADGHPVTFGRPGCFRMANGQLPEGFEEGQVFAPSEDRDGALWHSIEDGLRLFGFREDEVINVVRIPIVVQAVKEGVQYLPTQDSASINRPHALVAVAGDAAMTVHFWPGRGLNSGIKSGMALGDEIVHSLRKGGFVGLPLGAMKEYNDFIMKLQGREHDKRSIPILNQSGTPETLGWLLEKAHAVPDAVAVDWLVGAMTQIASRLETRSDWAFDPVANIEPQIRIVLRSLRSLTLREMAVSFPWPTREMGGAEVLPIRSMKPEEKQKWLQGLWNMLKDDNKGSSGKPRPKSIIGASPSSSARFEAPRNSVIAPRAHSPSPATSPLPSPPLERGISRSGAVRSARSRSVSGFENLSISNGSTRGRAPSAAMQSPQYESYLHVPNGQHQVSRDERAPSPASEAGLVRLLSTRRPNKAVLSEAMSLALFRVGE